jgi:hypothetical protein
MTREQSLYNGYLQGETGTQHEGWRQSITVPGRIVNGSVKLDRKDSLSQRRLTSSHFFLCPPQKSYTMIKNWLLQ